MKIRCKKHTRCIHTCSRPLLKAPGAGNLSLGPRRRKLGFRDLGPQSSTICFLKKCSQRNQDGVESRRPCALELAKPASNSLTQLWSEAMSASPEPETGFVHRGKHIYPQNEFQSNNSNCFSGKSGFRDWSHWPRLDIPCYFAICVRNSDMDRDRTKIDLGTSLPKTETKLKYAQDLLGLCIAAVSRRSPLHDTPRTENMLYKAWGGCIQASRYRKYCI